MFEGSLFVSGALMGAMVFFAAVIAPLVFQVLEPEPAGVFLRRIFPRLYRFGLVLALILFNRVEASFGFRIIRIGFH